MGDLQKSGLLAHGVVGARLKNLPLFTGNTCLPKLSSMSLDWLVKGSQSVKTSLWYSGGERIK